MNEAFNAVTVKMVNSDWAALLFFPSVHMHTAVTRTLVVDSKQGHCDCDILVPLSIFY